MKIIGCDFHPGPQQVAVFDSDTGEIEERVLDHASGEAECFYRELVSPALIGMEAIGNSLWFERMVAKLGHELRIGDAARIRASQTSRQKTERRDAAHILTLLLEKRFPRIWVPTEAERDQRQLLLHRSKLVRMRTQVKTELQHVALNQGMQLRRHLWAVRGRAALEALPPEGWVAKRREDLLTTLDMLESQIEPLDEAVARLASENSQARLLLMQPGVGPVTALAFVLTVGDVSRFAHSRELSSCVGLVPRESSSGTKRKLGAITKQATSFCALCWWRRCSRGCGMTGTCAGSINIAVTTRPEEWPKWRRRASWRCGCTGCFARRSRIRKVFASRAARVILWQNATGRSLEWAPSHPAHRAGCPQAQSWSASWGDRIDGLVEPGRFHKK